MKNLNPLSGLKQISTGKIYFHRELIIDLIKNQNLKPAELGYLMIFLVSADWNEGEYRFGFIRHDLKDLAKIWGISYNTLRDNLKTLEKKDLIDEKFKSYLIKNYEYFSKPKTYKETKFICEQLETQFKNSSNNNEISKNNQTTDTQSVKVTHKVNSKDNNYQYTKEDWQKLSKENEDLPLWENKSLIDEAIKESTPVKTFEEDVREALF